jgi:hypothetical protein
MTINKICGAFALVLILSACAKGPRETAATDNPEVAVSKMFTHDGCTVYRFSDAGNYVYYAKCEGGQTNTSWDRSCGKNCTETVNVPSDNSYPVQVE